MIVLKKVNILIFKKNKINNAKKVLLIVHCIYIKEGYFILNEEFIHQNGEKAQLIDENGKLSYKGEIGSMHEIAAKMMNGTPKVNAFDYLYVKRNNKLVSIADIRNRYKIDHDLPLEQKPSKIKNTIYQQ